jgi:hypothetical protein
MILTGHSCRRQRYAALAPFPGSLPQATDSTWLTGTPCFRIPSCGSAGWPALVNPVVICNDEYRFMVAEQLRQIDIQANAIILEPVGQEYRSRHWPWRRYAPWPGATIRFCWSFLPIITFSSPTSFNTPVNAGVEHARAGRLITFGIVPEKPETGYGYIKMGDPLPSADPDDAGRDHCRLRGKTGPGDGRDAMWLQKPTAGTAACSCSRHHGCWKSWKPFAPDIVSACRNGPLKDGRVRSGFFPAGPGGFFCLPQRLHRLCRDGKNRKRCHAAHGSRLERPGIVGSPVAGG